ncbi:DUF2497 domain-containing protein [Chelativorans sp.]|uniref:PopZ family protein n=1 Tax=Chelativorans sp. TaxID=2203393 RepID=UPI002811A3E5|nr:DUF2497 domain-containing protein [Chelativorans sp.]
MEEILASIRRIIEDSETGRKDEPGARTELDRSREVESFRAELRPTMPHALSARTEADRASPQRQRDPEPSLERQPSPADPDDTLHEDIEEEGAEDDLTIPIAANAPAAPGDREETAPPQPPSSLAITQPDKPGPTILSEVPGRKVAAAFEELNEALLAYRRKTVDQMAEEMLRPMLREWLDNNLPQLVERLVREEIERIARGV